MRDSRPKISAARLVLENPVLDSFVVENLFEEVGSLQFVAGWVRRVDAQVLLEPLNGQIGVVGKMVRRHAGRGERSGRRGGASVSGWSLDESNS